MLTAAQKTTLANALRAETNPQVVAALAIRDDVFLSQWCNTPGTTDVWQHEMSKADLFAQTDVARFDNITAGKRDAWRLMLDFAPVDFGKDQFRQAVRDVWGNADGATVLQNCRRKGTNGEVYLGGTVVSTATNPVTAALRLNRPGSIGIIEMSEALNANP